MITKSTFSSQSSYTIIVNKISEGFIMNWVVCILIGLVELKKSSEACYKLHSQIGLIALPFVLFLKLKLAPEMVFKPGI